MAMVRRRGFFVLNESVRMGYMHGLMLRLLKATNEKYVHDTANNMMHIYCDSPMFELCHPDDAPMYEHTLHIEDHHAATVGMALTSLGFTSDEFDKYYTLTVNPYPW